MDQFVAALNAVCPYYTMFPLEFPLGVRLRKAWKAACAQAGVPGRLPHDMRRSSIRNMVRDGVSETVAMKLSGHLTRSVFDRYNITSTRDQLRAAAQLRAATGAKTPDALHLVAALGAGCKTFVTNDRRLPTVPGLRVIQLSSYVDSQ